MMAVVRKRNSHSDFSSSKIKITTNTEENSNDKKSYLFTWMKWPTNKQILTYIFVGLIALMFVSPYIGAVSSLACVIFGWYMDWKLPLIYVKQGNVDDHQQKDLEPEEVKLSEKPTAHKISPSAQSLLRQRCEKLQDGSPCILKLPLEEVLRLDKDMIRKCELGKADFVGVPEKVIMVVGATGAGKTTLINGMINYILGVKWEDDYRYKMVADQDEEKLQNQAVSQTQWITAYTLCHQSYFTVPFTLTIIDTPGFGDTRGIEQDKTTMNKILKFFDGIGDKGIAHINAVGMVVQASNARLTHTQRFIFDSVLSIFGKDIEKNIFLMVTFADGQKPPVLSAVKEANIPFTMSSKFNNSALFASNKLDEELDEDLGSFDSMFWKMGMKSFENFFKQLNKTESRSLTLTKDVLTERNILETHVTGIHKQLQCGLSKLEQLQEECNIVSQHQADIDANREFKYKVKEDRVVQKALPVGQHTTTCLVCNVTCHEDCSIADDDKKRGCWAMSIIGGDCRICPRRCNWKEHKNVPYKLVIEQTIVEKTSTELQERYTKALGKKASADELIDELLEEFCDVQVNVIFLTDEIRRSIIRLKEIALRPNPLSALDYIDILIDSEQLEKRPGWKERVKQLQAARKQAEIIFNVADQTFDPFEKYRKKQEDYLKKDKDKKDNVLKKVAVTIRERTGKIRDNVKSQFRASRDKRDKLAAGSEIN